MGKEYFCIVFKNVKRNRCMNLFKKIWCRVYQGVFRIALPMMPYKEPVVKDSILEVKDILREERVTNVLLVTDKGIKDAGLARGLENDLSNTSCNVFVFDDVVPNPTIDNIEAGKACYEENKCEAIIALGGGSVMDCAKMIGARVANPDKTVSQMKGLLKVKNKLPVLIAIPTTAGTGSETTLTAVITDSSTHHKYTINDFDLIPKYAVLDESLTLKLPAGLTATTGMDAFTHAIEAYIGNSTTDFTRRCALDAIRLIVENLPKVYADPSNERARKYMLKASYLAGLAFSRSYVGYVHAIAHSLGGKYGTPHGLANAVILPYVLSEYGPKLNKKLKTMAVFAGIARPYDEEQIAASKFINKIFEFNETFGIPKKFDFINSEDIPELAKKADKEANPLYPVPKLMNAKELEKLYYKLQA